MIVAEPVIGNWYRRPNGSLFEVVAVDDAAKTIELQFFDGTIDEIEFETWPTLLTERVDAPEDWLGPMDMDPEDYTGSGEGIPQGGHDPLELLEQSEKTKLP